MIKYIVLFLFLIIIITSIEYNVNFHELWYPNFYKLPDKQVSNPFNSIIKDKEFINNANKGRSIALNSKVAICCLVRNNSKIFEKSKARIEYIAKHFKEYKIIIFENDSTDNSRELVENWSNINNNVILLDCCHLENCDCKLKTKKGYEYGSFSSERFGKMALYRQEYLNYLLYNLNHYDYMLVIDFDLDGNVNIDGLFDSLNKSDWGGIFCNGQAPIYGTLGFKTITYDSLANVFVEDDYNTINFNALKKYIDMNSKIDYEKTHFLEVKSSFNGYGIYKIKNLSDCSYIGNNNICEHINLAKCLHDKGEKLFVNSYWLGYFSVQGDSPIKTLYELLIKILS
jgi:hypothetical protein